MTYRRDQTFFSSVLKSTESINMNFIVHHFLVRASSNVRLRQFSKKISQSIVELNVFKTNSIDVTSIRKERTFTRVYLILLGISLSTLILYSSLLDRTRSKIHLVHSVLDYEQLLGLHLENLRCPCTRISLPYSAFITQFDVNSFHPVCTSDFVEDLWLRHLKNVRAPDWLSRRDFRFWGLGFFDTLEKLCTLAQITVANSLTAFGSSTLLTDQVMSRTQFDIQLNATLNHMEMSIPMSFARTLELLRTTTQGNALMTVYSLNWKFVLNEKNNSVLSVPVNYNTNNENRTCSCATSRSCSMAVQLFTSNSTPYHSIDGMRISCSLIESVLLSSLSCFYSSSCINALLEAIPMDGDDTLFFWLMPPDAFKPLNASSSRFAVNETLETVTTEMFIDSWIRNVSYEKFFYICAPTQCTSTYRYRFNFFDVFTLFLTVFNGITIGLRFLVPYLVELVTKIRNRLRVRVAPLQ
jgi:hypothetical protein